LIILSFLFKKNEGSGRIHDGTFRNELISDVEEFVQQSVGTNHRCCG
jgi:hypothetical protein